jgi:hypothetical protein
MINVWEQREADYIGVLILINHIISLIEKLCDIKWEKYEREYG